MTWLPRPTHQERRGMVLSRPYFVSRLGICPGGFPDPSNSGGLTRIVVLLVGPLDRFRIHLRFLTEISALFRNKTLAKTLLRLHSSRDVIQALREAESPAHGPPGSWRRFKRFFAGLFSLGALS